MSNYFDLFNEIGSDLEANSSYTEEQLNAICSSFNTSSLIRAGAGSGKTKVAVARICKLLKNGADPKRIALISFTKAAANELKSRILTESNNKKEVDLLFSGTVHSLAYKILIEKIPKIVIKDESHYLQALSELDPFQYLPSECNYSLAEILLFINKAREEKNSSTLFGMLGSLYKKKLESENIYDFTRILEEAESVLKSKNLFDYIVVDESQDLALLQYSFIKKVGPKAHYWFVGDEDQSIYSFRGSKSSMMSFLETQCDQSFVLSKNFRCCPVILEKANNLISHNEDRLHIQWQSAKEEQGIFSITENDLESQESRAKELLSIYGDKNFTVLARTQNQVQNYLRKGIPCKTVHEAKGLEWDCVLVIDCNQNSFPHKMGNLSEERRLFYVAMTRAKKHLELSYNNSIKSKKSQFLNESLERN